MRLWEVNFFKFGIIKNKYILSIMFFCRHNFLISLHCQSNIIHNNGTFRFHTNFGNHLSQMYAMQNNKKEMINFNQIETIKSILFYSPIKIWNNLHCCRFRTELTPSYQRQKYQLFVLSLYLPKVYSTWNASNHGGYIIIFVLRV